MCFSKPKAILNKNHENKKRKKWNFDEIVGRRRWKWESQLDCDSLGNRESLKLVKSVKLSSIPRIQLFSEWLPQLLQKRRFIFVKFPNIFELPFSKNFHKIRYENAPTNFSESFWILPMILIQLIEVKPNGIIINIMTF